LTRVKSVLHATSFIKNNVEERALKVETLETLQTLTGKMPKDLISQCLRHAEAVRQSAVLAEVQQKTMVDLI
jgi:hypothetical protein